MRARSISFLKHWLPPLIWSVAILIASGSQFSSSNTGHWLRDLVESVGYHLPPPVFATLHAILRKTGHLVAYGILSALWFRAVRRDDPTPWLLRWAIGAVALTVLVAATDEWHQSLIASRTGAIQDVFIDSCGAILAQGLIRMTQVLITFRS